MENMNNIELEQEQEYEQDQDYMYDNTTVKPEKSLAEKVATGVLIGAGVLALKALVDKAKPVYDKWKDQREIKRLQKRGYNVTSDTEPVDCEYSEVECDVGLEENEEE
jgi:hypothetical protein